jgi:hypothetical protein
MFFQTFLDRLKVCFLDFCTCTDSATTSHGILKNDLLTIQVCVTCNRWSHFNFDMHVFLSCLQKSKGQMFTVLISNRREIKLISNQPTSTGLRQLKGGKSFYLRNLRRHRGAGTWSQQDLDVSLGKPCWEAAPGQKSLRSGRSAWGSRAGGCAWLEGTSRHWGGHNGGPRLPGRRSHRGAVPGRPEGTVG